eukprot:jgi/Tetstr1/439151/TSEL_027603.t1
MVVYVDDMIFAFKDAAWRWSEDWDNATLKVHQAKYIDDMLHKFNLAYAFAALVCSVLDAMVATRPNIAEAVSKLCRAMAKPEERH